MRARPIPAGTRAGRWTTLEDAPTVRRSRVRCRCECGTEKTLALEPIINGHSRASGYSKSCGCLRDETASRVNSIHGLRGHPLYATWLGMMHRCTDPRAKGFKNYGGRGIRVCEQWQDVSVFIGNIEQNLGPRPEGMTLDRINNDGNYEPGNVRWATASQQRTNRRHVCIEGR
jgi:hypothetical protein